MQGPMPQSGSLMGRMPNLPPLMQVKAEHRWRCMLAIRLEYDDMTTVILALSLLILASLASLGARQAPVSIRAGKPNRLGRGRAGPNGGV